jgi:protein arginine kinase activator
MCDKPAVVHEVTIVHGAKREVHLCVDHANEAGVAMPGMTSTNKLLSKFSAGGKPTVMAPRCPECETSFAQIRQHSLIGCPSCYDTFEEPLGRLIERAQAGATHHAGRGDGNPDRSSEQMQRERRLMDALASALSHEQYERAAEIRDQINQLSDKSLESESN